MMRKFPVVLILAMILVLSFASATWAAENEKPCITVSGEGTVDITPDRTDITLSVVTEGADAFVEWMIGKNTSFLQL